MFNQEICFYLRSLCKLYLLPCGVKHQCLLTVLKYAAVRIFKQNDIPVPIEDLFIWRILKLTKPCIVASLCSILRRAK